MIHIIQIYLRNIKKTKKKIGILTDLFLFLWLEREDSNLRMPAPKTGALPLGHAPTQFLFTIKNITINHDHMNYQNTLKLLLQKLPHLQYVHTLR